MTELCVATNLNRQYSTGGVWQLALFVGVVSGNKFQMTIFGRRCLATDFMFTSDLQQEVNNKTLRLVQCRSIHADNSVNQKTLSVGGGRETKHLFIFFTHHGVVNTHLIYIIASSNKLRQFKDPQTQNKDLVNHFPNQINAAELCQNCAFQFFILDSF